MKNWEKAEQIVARHIGGRRTPGSGNRYIRGDVKAPGRRVEVKQTDTGAMSIEREWLEDLEAIEAREGVEVAFAVFFGLAGYAYYPTGSKGPYVPWQQRRAAPDSMPETLETARQTWELDEIGSLKEWAKR